LIGYSFAAKNSANTNNTTTNAPQLNPDQVTSPKDNNTTAHNNTKNIASNRDKVSTSKRKNKFAQLYVRSVAVVRVFRTSNRQGQFSPCVVIFVYNYVVYFCVSYIANKSET
jgi:hypothetical protein